MNLSIDLTYMQQAIKLANAAELEGNLPIAALVVESDTVIAQASNKTFHPEFHPGRHAEIEALNQIPGKYLHQNSRGMILYTTQEPCVMCVGTIIMYRIGKVVFGGKDPNRGAVYLLEHLSKIYPQTSMPEIIGPIMPGVCDLMFERANQIWRSYRG